MNSNPFYQKWCIFFNLSVFSCCSVCLFIFLPPSQDVSVSCSKTANCSYSITCYSICTICTTLNHILLWVNYSCNRILPDVAWSGTQENLRPWSPIIFQPNKKINSGFTRSGQRDCNWIKYCPLSASSYLALHQACTATCRVVIWICKSFLSCFRSPIQFIKLLYKQWHIKSSRFEETGWMWAYPTVAKVLFRMSAGDHFTKASPHKKLPNTKLVNFTLTIYLQNNKNK